MLTVLRWRYMNVMFTINYHVNCSTLNWRYMNVMFQLFTKLTVLRWRYMNVMFTFIHHVNCSTLALYECYVYDYSPCYLFYVGAI